MSEREYRKWEDTSQPGRLDKHGVEWWACDPYPTWFRRENGELHVKDSGGWAE